MISRRSAIKAIRNPYFSAGDAVHWKKQLHLARNCWNEGYADTPLENYCDPGAHDHMDTSGGILYRQEGVIQPPGPPDVLVFLIRFIRGDFYCDLQVILVFRSPLNDLRQL